MKTEIIKTIIENIEEFEELAHKAAETYLTLKGKYYRDIENISYYNGVADIEYNSSGCGCCRDIDSEYMPLDFFLDNDWQERVKAEVIREQKEAERKAKRAKNASVKREKARRLANYKKLKEEFEGEE